MKKILSIALSLSLSASMFTGATMASADEITVELDGQKIEFDVNPEIVDGRTMVPMRKIFEEIGALVKWDGETKTVSARKNSKTITISIDSNELKIDKGKTDDEGNPIIETVTLDVPAKIVSGRTLVPARAVTESFGFDVDWEKSEKKVIIASNDKEDDAWKENVGSINLTDLTYKGKGVEIAGNQIKITSGGDFTLTGTLKDGNITVSTKERVKLRLSGVKITSSDSPCIYVEDADKAYITIVDGTENNLVAENAEDGAIYSKENLEIKGKGSLDIVSKAGHGIKASDNLNIENGILSIDAAGDGIHINDTFKMIDGNVKITAVGDGIDSESIVNISGGLIDIETNGTPVETPKTTEETTPTNKRRPMWEEDNSVEFENSTKGINAEWMMVISGGEMNINSASHAIHCQDEIEISGGKFSIESKYDKGISAHGNLTISGRETVIDIKKSVEGLESKNVMTINDGVIKVISTDDAINATGGNSGMMMHGGNFGNDGEGGNRVPIEGNENGRIPGAGQNRGNNREQGQGTRPQRGENGQLGGMIPDGEMSWDGFVPPFDFGNGEVMPPFEMPENGEFIPSFENGEFTTPTGNRPPMNLDGGFAGGMGGMGRDMKKCLVINGGYLELCGNDDCIDANGNMNINGGTIMAANPTGAFTGNFGVLDADGKINITENANIILASSSGKAFAMPQNSIVVYCENNHTEEDKITIVDEGGNIVYEYTPKGSFKAILIASTSIKFAEKYTITVGTEKFETEITGQSTVIGTQPTSGMGFGKMPRMQ